MHEVQGVVARAKGEPVSIETIHVPDPGPGEALVQVQACGVCHTDLHYREGGINDDFPFLLGHEAAGVVEAVGDGVTSVAPGDFVILNWRAVCGNCRACNRGEPWYCFATHNATQKMTLADGTPLSPALGIGAFAEKTLVAAGQCTKVDPSARAAAVGLLGCGVMAGLGAAINTGNVSRGKSVAVIGCGGVGAAAIAGSVLAGADTDHRGRHRRPEARGRTLDGRHPHREQHRPRPGGRDPGAHRRQRRRRRHRRGRPARDLEAGVLRPRPGRHRGPGRRADARHEDPRHPADRRLRSRWGAEVVVVRRLPARPRLPDAGLALPAGPARPRRVRVRGDRARRRGGGVREDAPRATCCAVVVVF